MGKAKRHSGAALAAAGMLLTAVLAGQLPGREVWQELGQRAMMVSAVCSMPSQGLELLERRFAGEEETEQPKEPEPAADPAKTQEEAPAAEEAAEDPVEDQEELPQGQQEPGEAQTAEEEASQPEEIPEEYQGPVVEEDFSGSGISCGAGLVKNSTELSDEEVRELIAAENQVTLSAQGPQVLIMHTHATESFERWDRPVYDTRSTWRTTDNSQNMVAVGEVIAQELQKPGRDPRDELPRPILRTDVLEMKDLKPGMELTGTVRNVIDFGVFVDIGVHQDGLVHISQLREGRRVQHPSEVCAVGDIVTVWVLEVDEKKKRIGLSMKQVPKA